MRQRFEGADSPRPLSPHLRERLRRTIALGEEKVALTDLDAPLPIPPASRERLKSALVSSPRRGRRWMLTTQAVAALALIMTSTSVLATMRRGPGPVAPVAAPSPTPSSAATPSPEIHAPAPPQTFPPGSLRKAESPSLLLRHIRAHALKIVGPYGLPSSDGSIRRVAMGTSAAPAAEGDRTDDADVAESDVASDSGQVSDDGLGYSGTNVQEGGVDEPDIVKTDGRKVVALAQGRLWVAQRNGATIELKGSVSLESPTEPDAQYAPATAWGHREMFMAGNRIVVIGTYSDALPSASGPSRWITRTRAAVVSVSDPANPAVVSTLSFDGRYVSARMVGGIVRLVVVADSTGPQMTFPSNHDDASSVEAALKANRAAISTSKLHDWTPHYTIERPGRRTATGHMVEWADVYLPEDFAGMSLVTVLTFDPRNPQPDGGTSVLGGGDTVYASQQNLYVTTRKVLSVAADSFAVQIDDATRIHKFSIAGEQPAVYLGSGEVQGYILNQFSLSEHEGVLRVATTAGIPSVTLGSSESFVTTLVERDRKLDEVGKVGNLGKGERIYSVRFVGKLGYVVTFRQIDPLYVIDLSDPAAPAIRGELKIPGFSSYLHPMAGGYLLGIGRDVDESTDRPGGLQLSVFDVRDPAKPRRIHNLVFGGQFGHSEAAFDHHAFLYWEPRDVVVIPLQVPDEESGIRSTAAVVKVTVGEGFGEVREVRHSHHIEKSEVYLSTLRRSLVIGDSLITMSDAGLQTNHIVTLEERGWVRFA